MVLLASTYQTNSWLTITHYIDTESDLMHVYLNEEFLGQVPYDGLKWAESTSTQLETKSTSHSITSMT